MRDKIRYVDATSKASTLESYRCDALATEGVQHPSAPLFMQRWDELDLDVLKLCYDTVLHARCNCRRDVWALSTVDKLIMHTSWRANIACNMRIYPVRKMYLFEIASRDVM